MTAALLVAYAKPLGVVRLKAVMLAVVTIWLENPTFFCLFPASSNFRNASTV